ncbi:MAG: type IV pilus secretin PilQ [Gammaproteobacteria bacterium]
MRIESSINFKSKINSTWRLFCASVFLLLVFSNGVLADELHIISVDFNRSSSGKLQFQLEMDGPAVEPKVFHTDNPARIALDFAGVKSALKKKKFPINLGVADSLYVAESGDRVRVVINLASSVPYETKVEGNKFLVSLKEGGERVGEPLHTETALMPEIDRSARKKIVSKLMPEQGITNIDFRRGPKGEGRILISLAKPNTLVNTREVSGKVEVSFVNTRLPASLSKRLDVSEFATPVRFVDASASHLDTKITVELQNKLYDYSLFQSEGLLTVEFRPLTEAEKTALASQREKYTGDRLSLNFQDIEIRSVITLLAEFTGQNVVAGDDVTGTVTVKLDDVPWDEALDFIMMTKGLEKYKTGNVTLVAPVGKIKEYKEKQRETEQVVEQAEPLQTEYIKINYARAENFRNLMYGRDAGSFGQCGISGSRSGSSGSSGSSQSRGGGGFGGQMGGGGFGQQQMGMGAGGSQGAQSKSQTGRFTLMSPRGTVVVDGRTNTLIVRETSARLTEIKKLIRKLDIPVRQVMIETRIVVANSNFAKELGVKFGVAKAAQFGSNQTFAIGGGGRIDNGETTRSDINGVTQVNDVLVDLATSSNPYGALGMTLARGADYVLNLELSALQDQEQGELLSNPRVLTSDRCQAVIEQGTQLPFQTSSGNLGTNIEFKNATLTLTVTPQITPSGSVIMDLEINKDQPGQQAVNGNREIDTRKVATNVQVEDGETVVLGGIYESDRNNVINSVPFFSDLPGIGFLFKRTNNTNNKRELLIFVTPKIMKENVASY